MATLADSEHRFASEQEIEHFGTEPIPTAPYYDPEYFKLEAEAIFRKNWLQIGHICELPNPGSYIVRLLEVAKTALSRLPYGPVHNWALADDEGGYAVTSAAGRRARVLQMDKANEQIYG